MSNDKLSQCKQQSNNHNDDSDIDEHGNVRNLIDYDLTSEEEETPSKKQNTNITHSSERPMRKAAIAALKKIERYFMQDTTEENKIHYPTVKRNLTPSKRKYSSNDEEISMVVENLDNNSEYQDEFEFNEEYDDSDDGSYDDSYDDSYDSEEDDSNNDENNW